MEEDKLGNLRGAYYSLLNCQRVLEEDVNRHLVERSTFRPLEMEIYRIQGQLPLLLPSFVENDFRKDEKIYDAVGLRVYLAMALGRLKSQLDTYESTPVTETRKFSFIKDVNLRKVLERDYIEIQRAYVTQCWKSVIILSGGAIEAILLDLLRQNQSSALAASKAPKGEPDITKWHLSDLINVAVELELVSSGVEKLSHSVREYRNLIHPGNEIRTRTKFGEEEARIALEVVNMVHRDLSSRHSS